METIVERPAGAGCAQGAGDRVRARARSRAAGASSTWRSSRRRCGACWRCATGWPRTGCTQVAMEATGVYWKPVWAILEDEFELLLVNARHVKQVPGRKTDVSDAAWLCQLAEAGLLRASFVPPKPIRALRNLTRYRKTQIQERAAGGQPAAQGARGHRDQARLRRHRHPRRLRAGDARRARSTAPPTPRSSPSWPRAGCARRSRRCREALEGRFDRLHARLDRRDPRPPRLPRRADRPALRRDRGADRPFRAGR